MRISRLYLPLPLQSGETVSLDEDSAHYLRSVLRLKPGADLVVFNGEGGEFPARVLEAHREGVRLDLGERRERESESPLFTHLGLGISRGERMDLAIQKAVELGVSQLTPLFTEHCVVQLDAAKQAQRLKHWQGVVRSACEQCGRNRLPLISSPAHLDAWIGAQTGARLLLHPVGGVSLSDLPRPDGAITLLSGPEGGFSEREREAAIAAGFTALRLGPRVLRTETAALAALAAIQTLWGDLGGDCA
jgi:16S rRNA (uracil1498-N3)-methyltransferase